MLSIMNRIGARIFVRAMLLIVALSVVCLCTSVDVCAKDQRRIHEVKGDGDDVSGIRAHPPSNLEAVEVDKIASVPTGEADYQPIVVPVRGVIFRFMVWSWLYR